MPEPSNRVLIKMLDRLFGAITTGPSLNCRPHSSRQRIDFTHLARLGDTAPAAAFREILSDRAAALLVPRIPPPAVPQRVSWRRHRASSQEEPGAEAAPVVGAEAPEPEPVGAARRAWTDQFALLAKLRVIADEARTYEEDTGVYVLNIGFPLLSLPPGMAGGGSHGQPGTRRVLAPVAFIPVSLTIKTGASPAVELECRNDEIDRVSPNQALMAWLEQQTGRLRPADLFADEEGVEPWREIRELVRHVCDSLKIAAPDLYMSEPLPQAIPLVAAPRAEESGTSAAILPCAVMGLYPLANQGLLHDTQAMLAGDALDGPVASFIRAGARFEAPPPAAADERRDLPRGKEARNFPQERLIAVADPCQSRAVGLARRSPALVIHGPPGTGKSQTITNIIGDHLSRSERVLFVCDKRTALDVVANRLEHLGLGKLCALVHDPQRDQRDLYMSIREQLESLADTKTSAKAERDLQRVDEELASLHAELTQHHAHLMAPPEVGEPSFHDLVGQWLSLAAHGGGLEDGAGRPDPGSLRGVTLRQLDALQLDITTVLRRADEVAFAGNPWARCVSLGLEEFLARPAQAVRGTVAACAAAAAEADELLDPGIPAFVAGVSLEQQAGARTRLADDLERALSQVPGAVRSMWASRAPEAIEGAGRHLDTLRPHIEALRTGPADAELSMLFRSSPVNPHELTRQLGALEAYLATARRWYGFLSVGRRRAAANVLARYGLALGLDGAERLRAFLTAVRAMLVLRDVLDQWEATGSRSPSSPAADQPAPLPEQSQLARDVGDTALVIEILARTHANRALGGLYPAVCAALSGAGGADLVAGLVNSAPRAGALARLEQTVASGNLFDARWQEKAFAVWRRGRPEDTAATTIHSLQSSLSTLEGVLRVRDGLNRLPQQIGDALRRLVGASTPMEQSLAALRQAVLAAEITARLDSTPALRTLDARRMQTIFERYRQLEQKKTALVRDSILHRWVSRQRERLLASTGSRLNTGGADLRRRLTVRGKKAMRLRQVLAFGQNLDGGDPLMDLRPVWMASPETVAQLFQRLPAFDTVIFDEASQCRLEEALPVLTRAKRVVIAGDPKQLPPTRFFESAIAGSDVDDMHTEQQLFEVHQGEIEDLLGAALCLDLERCYLDVHYRSRNSDLVAFSNQQFYSSRLQPIPGHPRNRARYAPISMYRVNGVYDKRTNIAEAEQVCRIVRDLLRRADPPTIGVGCFNLVQRDLIIEKLDDLATQDADFAPRLAAARNRRGHGTFEGLFVKNLENVQGDERDHIIISTTYGPDPTGKFYRRFGPLAQPGGGRRLNVLVTRARSEVHLVTSIPREAYHALPPIPEGETPGGGYLLYAYLNYAEQLSARYETAHAVRADNVPESVGFSVPTAAEQAPHPAGETGRPPPVSIFETTSPSTLAEALAHRLAAASGVGSDVYWGNDGFCVDLALRHPARTQDVTIGVLCDTSRFPLADDPIEWDAFRTSVLESQGWTLHRVWSPSIFHDAPGSLETIGKLAAANEATDDSCRVTPRPRRG